MRVALDLRMSAHLKLRPAASADVIVLSQLTEEFGYPADPAVMRSRIEKLADRKDDLLLVCEVDDGTVAGWMQAHACTTFESGFRAVILGLVVAKKPAASGHRPTARPRGPDLGDFRGRAGNRRAQQCATRGKPRVLSGTRL